MEENKDILNNLKKTKTPEVPEGFFENFSDDLLSKISDSDNDINKIKKTDKVSVPDGFFENFSDNLMEKINDSTPNKGRIITLKVMGFVSAVAACLLVMFTVMPNDEEKETAETAVENVQEIMSDDELMAYMDEEEIIDFIIENEDIDLEDASTVEDEDVFYFLEEDIEEYYLEEEL